MDTLDIAALLALASALCVAIGDVLQQRATHRIADKSLSLLQLFAKLLRVPRWRLGVLILVVSIALQAAALNQGSVLLVQALLVLSLLFALPIGARLAQRPVTSREWIWAVLLTTAVCVVVTVGNPQAGRANASLQTWALVVAVLFALVSGTLWGVFAVLTKGAVHRLAEGGWAVFRCPELYAWILVALGGFAWEQSAFRAGALTASMPTLQVSQPVVAASLGVVVLGETLNTGRAGMLALSAAALVVAVATVQLARVDAVETTKRVEATPGDSVEQPA
jgi:drug/metabolite transporter (DMT)-like permease